jgi:hypothetical protein
MLGRPIKAISASGQARRIARSAGTAHIKSPSASARKIATRRGVAMLPVASEFLVTTLRPLHMCA